MGQKEENTGVTKHTLLSPFFFSVTRNIADLVSMYYLVGNLFSFFPLIELFVTRS